MTIPTYLILGTPTSGRREIVLDTVTRGFDDSIKCAVFVSENEMHNDAQSKLSESAKTELFTFKSVSDAREKLDALDAEKYSCVFYVADSSKNIADEIENFKSLVDAGKIRLARIWSVVDCHALDMFPRECEAYVDALSHFADCLLLSRRHCVSNKAVSELEARYQKQCRPHLTLLVNKKFETPNPAELLVEEARRISMVFDDIDPIDELELDEDNLPEEPFNLERKPDPYLQKMPNGMRIKPLKNVADFSLKAREAEQNNDK